MEKDCIKIPDIINRRIAGKACETDVTGLSDSKVMLFSDCVLKVERERVESDQEHIMMKWLQGRLPVPEILASEKADGVNYLLMSRMDGEMACSETYLEQPEELVRLLARGIRMLWDVDISGCPCDNLAEKKLRIARMQVEAGLCSMENVEPDTYGENGFRNPGELLAWLEMHKPEEEPVFSHGDYCLPNIFLADNKIKGFIDLGRSGIADKYQDIALCFRSLSHNLDGTYGGKVYGNFDNGLLSAILRGDFEKEKVSGHNLGMQLFRELNLEPDWEKVRYYLLLDELF